MSGRLRGLAEYAGDDQPYTTNQERLDSLPGWLHDYNWHRLHTAIGTAPANRLPVNNLCVKDT